MASEPFYDDGWVKQYQGNALDILAQLPAESIQCCVTSPPYWGLRDYGIDGQLGQESTPEEYVANLVSILRSLRRVLRDDGTLWLNLGDSYFGSWGDYVAPESTKHQFQSETRWRRPGYETDEYHDKPPTAGKHTTLKKKDLVGIPWRVAFALQSDGWWLRSDIIWAKGISFCPEYSGTCMPESVTDRPTKGHEYLFLLAKSEKYYYDIDAIREPLTFNRWSMSNKLGSSNRNIKSGDGAPGQTPHSWERKGHSGYYDGEGNPLFNESGRNIRTVWAINPQGYKEAHFATFPSDLVRPCLLAGTSEKGNCSVCGKPWVRVVEKTRTYQSGSGKAGNKPAGKWDDGQCSGSLEDGIRAGPCVESKTLGWKATCDCNAPTTPAIVLDCFSGSGTTGEEAKKQGRKAILIDISASYCELAKQRIGKVSLPMIME